MSDWIYTVRERFTPAYSKNWSEYAEWSGFTHISELVTLDSVLCEDRIDDLTPQDWQHNVQADCRLTWFTDLDYLRQHHPLRRDLDQLIAAVEKPDTVAPPPSQFTHCGFDIVDAEGAISVLTNCGRFPGIFEPDDVNSVGLIDGIDLAQAIAHQLRMTFPDEPHCHDCRVWQVARQVTAIADESSTLSN